MDEIQTIYTSFKAALDKYSAAVTALSDNLDEPMDAGFDAAAARKPAALGRAAWACHDECGEFVLRVAGIQAEVGSELNGLLGRCFELGVELRGLMGDERDEYE
ncbi:uncharacterized protein LAJ45_01071 [Morchella importuna]|uniref:uncharacterized protein n=1 Tax=Morchella importuna TaxID=1174673 RepID=UPI001E8DEACA|nr:uncharacterized protein LAJ45_01071 [Morchella importuna]KAH8154543.1 hypothetical protein LAJ45_01071 [Morchella importuna]